MSAEYGVFLGVLRQNATPTVQPREPAVSSLHSKIGRLNIVAMKNCNKNNVDMKKLNNKNAATKNCKKDNEAIKNYKQDNVAMKNYRMTTMPL